MSRSVLIGINYIDTRYELKGCVNDVINIKALLLTCGYLETEITMLTDHTDNKPTG